MKHGPSYVRVRGVLMIGLVGSGTVWMIRQLDSELVGSADWVIEWIAKKIVRDVMSVALEGAWVLRSF
jgi:hypothetical protein